MASALAQVFSTSIRLVLWFPRQKSCTSFVTFVPTHFNFCITVNENDFKLLSNVPF